MKEKFKTNLIGMALNEPITYPDEYTHTTNRPNGEFIISRTSEGLPLSRYKDEMWDLSPYRNLGAVGQTKIFFNFEDEGIKNEIKWIMFLIIFVAKPEGRSSLSTMTVLGYMKPLKLLAKFSEISSLDISSILSSKESLTKFIATMNTRTNLCGFSSILHHLMTIPSEISTYKILGVSKQEIISKKLATFEQDNQHPVIPPRILSELISQLNDFIDLVYADLDPLVSFIERLISDEQFGRCASKQVKLGFKKSDFKPHFFEAASIYGVDDLFIRFNICNIPSTSTFLTRIQHACRLFLHIYSGMRRSEVLSLTTDAYSAEKTDIRNIFKLTGKTSKLVGQEKPVSWITSKDIEKPFQVAKRIAILISNSMDFSGDAPPLFVSSGYLPLNSNASAETSNIHLAHTSNKNSEIFNYLDNEKFIIKDTDLNHLELVNPFRAWEAEEAFSIGSQWRFTTHQFRRSLAFYCAQSGNVSLPSLKRQLKHLSREMSLYYCQSSSLVNEFTTEDHIFNFFNNKRAETDATCFINNVLYSGEKLLGAHGAFLEKNRKFSSDQVILKSEREDLVRQFRKGEIAYKETPLGACTTITPCNKRLFRSLAACISCSHAIIKKRNLDKVIRRQAIFVKELEDEDKNSVEYRTELDELTILNSFRSRLIKNGDDK
jgi:integrase